LRPRALYLFPHKTALENIIEAPVRVRGVRKEKAVAEAEELLARVGLRDSATSIPESSPVDNSSEWRSPGRSR